ncbi:hypothetical protein BDR04DRAFT_1159405 [Suillus decipiens]|nr:hypothetical protein BDR04DRAFT_1159405 [Suillus decipiens]
MDSRIRPGSKDVHQTCPKISMNPTSSRCPPAISAFLSVPTNVIDIRVQTAPTATAASSPLSSYLGPLYPGGISKHTEHVKFHRTPPITEGLSRSCMLLFALRRFKDQSSGRLWKIELAPHIERFSTSLLFS